MPKFGLKYFAGSFLLSLVAIFAATKTYIIMSLQEEKQEILTLNSGPAKNIELFAFNEESDPIYEKFKLLDKKEAKSSEDNNINKGNINAAATENYAEAASEIISDDSGSELSADDMLAATDDTDAAFTEESPIVLAEEDETLSDEESSELQIADASEAKSFYIPLQHNFSDNQSAAEVSHHAAENQIASANNNVSVDNLGIKATSSQHSELSTSVAMPKIGADEDPWEVAETANPHTAKNANAKKKSAEASKENQLDENGRPAYKMQKNLLIPIPEDIMNEKNLTPQFSSSAENKKLEEKLRRESSAKQKVVPQVAPKADNKNADDDFDDNDEEASQSLSESIAAWFSDATPATDKSKGKEKSQAKSNTDQDNPIFQKLMGTENNDKKAEKAEEIITPTELKLSFQPNRAEISGQTLEWLRAFSENAVKYENVMVEIRIPETAPMDLQQKRLNLLYRILANNGVNYNKINVIFTDREPNSFIIRNVRYATREEVIAAKLKAAKEAEKAAKEAQEAAKKALEEEKNSLKKGADNPWF